MSVTIPCPKCKAGLKLPDRRLLGKRGKCPRCEHRFVLEDPDEVELTLAEPEAPAAPPAEEAPLVGTFAKWVPDMPASTAPIPSPALPSDGPSPPEAPAVPEVPSAGESPDFSGLGVADGASDLPQVSRAAGEFDFSTAEPPASTRESSRSKKSGKTLGRRERKRRRNSGPALIGVSTAVVAFFAIVYWWQQSWWQQSSGSLVTPGNSPTTEEKAQATQRRQQEAESRKQKALVAESLSPTSGGVIPSELIPFTPHLICHLRPSEIWSDTPRNQEFVALTFDLGSWVADLIRSMTRFEPREIEEVTFAVNFGARTSTPAVAAIVRLVSAATPSDLQLNRFRGQLRSDLSEQIYENEEWIYMLADPKTFVVAPKLLAAEVIQAKQFPATPSVELEVLQKESDRTRMASLLFDVANIDTHREYIFGEDLQVVADQFVQWFGQDIRAVCWSMHLTNSQLFMETLLHPDNESSSLRAQRHVKIQLARLPERLVDAARLMQPSTAGYRKLIGRFPAMMKATELGTTTHAGDSFVRMITLLPSGAGANLAAAALTTWNQSLVTDFSAGVPVASAGPKIPDTVKERLQIRLIGDFRRTPLQEVLDYIADEIKTPITINGAALKASALTQNLAQSFDLGEVPAVRILDEIFSNPEYRGALVMVVDEVSKSIEITTRPVAEEAGQTIFDTSQ